MQQYKKRDEFATRLIGKYHKESLDFFGSSLIYRTQKEKRQNLYFHRHMERIFNQSLTQRFQQIENRYYQNITSRDHQRLLKNVEQIYRKPGEKKQMLGLMQKLGVVTREEKGWQEIWRRLDEYEEALGALQKQLRHRDIQDQKRERQEHQQPSMREISRSVMQDLRQELRLERMRSGRL